MKYILWPEGVLEVSFHLLQLSFNHLKHHNTYETDFQIYLPEVNRWLVPLMQFKTFVHIISKV